MLYCTKCRTVCADSTRACPNCKRSQSLRPVKDSDEVFFLKVNESEAGEIAALFEELHIRHRVEPIPGGFSVSVFDPEYIPTDKNIFVEYQDLERANETMAKETEDPAPPEADEMPKGKRMLVQSLSIIGFMVIVAVLVFATDFVANLLKELFMK